MHQMVPPHSVPTDLPSESFPRRLLHNAGRLSHLRLLVLLECALLLLAGQSLLGPEYSRCRKRDLFRPGSRLVRKRWDQHCNRLHYRGASYPDVEQTQHLEAAKDCAYGCLCPGWLVSQRSCIRTLFAY